MKKINPKADLTSQALCERINDISSVNLMKEVLAELIRVFCDKRADAYSESNFGLEGINRILLQDSTVITLNEKLEKKFKGTVRGVSSIKSQVKIDLIYDLGKGIIIDASIFQGNKNDQSLAERIMSIVKSNDLIIRDLGYFNIKIFQAIIDQSAFFLSRIKAGVIFYLCREDKKPLDLGEYLKGKEVRNKNIIELRGYLGIEKMPIRLVIYRQPENITAERVRKARKNIRKKGQTLSKKQLLLLSVSIFVTNVPKEILQAEVIGTVYRLRWEIELVFKRWKSLLKIDYLKGINPDRIECLIWSRLCMIVIIDFVKEKIKKISKKISTIEISEIKIIQYLTRANYFFEAFINNELKPFFQAMKKDIQRMLLKDKRERKTMREKVEQKESYYKSQNFDDKDVKFKYAA